MEQKNQMGTLLTAFITVVIGLALLGGIADPISEQDDILTAVNETHTSVAFSFEVNNQPIIDRGLAGSVVSYSNLNNGSNASIGTNNWDGYSNGSVILKGVLVDGAYNITYNHYSDTYISSVSARTFTRLVILFFVIGIFAVLILWVRKSEWFTG